MVGSCRGDRYLRMGGLSRGEVRVSVTLGYIARERDVTARN